jgi:hypothetical protein
MTRRGTYLGGSTMIGPGSDWFSRPKPKIVKQKKASKAKPTLKVKPTQKLPRPEEVAAKIARKQARELKIAAETTRLQLEKEEKMRLREAEEFQRAQKLAKIVNTWKQNSKSVGNVSKGNKGILLWKASQNE